MGWRGVLVGCVVLASVASACVERVIVEGDGAASGAGAGDDVDEGERDDYGESAGSPCTPQTCEDGPVQCCDGGACAGAACDRACEAPVVCGAALDTCCAALEVCIDGACVAPEQTCGDDYECPQGDVCDPVLGVCVPRGSCTAVGDFETLSVRLEWSVENFDVLTLPAIANLDADPEGEVVVVSARTDELGGSNPPHTENGELWVLDGQDGAVQLHIDADESSPVAPDVLPVFTPLGIAAPGIADLDGDGTLEIVYGARRIDDTDDSWVRAVDLAGGELWRTTTRLAIRRSNPTFLDAQGDGRAEAAFGAAVIGGGQILASPAFDGRAENAPLHGSNELDASDIPRGNGGIAVIADLDGDGVAELVTGRSAWAVGPDAALTERWRASVADGWPVVGDLDLDGRPEVVVVGQGQVQVVDGQTGGSWCPTASAGCIDGVAAWPIPGGGRGGPAALADFDGDGRPEVAVAGARTISVVDLVDDALVAAWSSPISDEASSGTGASAFDFQGDGRAEVLFADECTLRVFDGGAGDVMLELPNTQSTSREYPVVADVDADGRGELVVVANGFASANCPGQVARRGVFVYGAEGQAWSRARRAWTTHAHRVGVTDGAGGLRQPLFEDWSDPVLNAVRTAGYGAGPEPAADLQVSASVSCVGGSHVVARIRNAGAITANVAGVVVRLLRDGAVLDERPLQGLLVPGEVVDVAFAVASPIVDLELDVVVGGVLRECDEANNGVAVPDTSCAGVSSVRGP
ncbi:MAG: VCBS repeat-containing protein [Myxococcota bacterium]